MPVESVYSWLQSETHSKMELSGMVGRGRVANNPTFAISLLRQLLEAIGMNVYFNTRKLAVSHQNGIRFRG